LQNFCFICKEEILVEENEDDDWVLKDGLRVTTKADETIKVRLPSAAALCL
jgi:hypothetical protein